MIVHCRTEHLVCKQENLVGREKEGEREGADTVSIKFGKTNLSLSILSTKMVIHICTDCLAQHKKKNSKKLMNQSHCLITKNEEKISYFLCNKKKKLIEAIRAPANSFFRGICGGERIKLNTART